jgi:ornithine cyclodeaminase/alanine dehydrogenase-like protein (mu-crystallin family)
MTDLLALRYLSRDDVIRAARDIDAVAVVRDALTLHADGATTLPDEAYLPWHTSTGAFARGLALPGALWGPRPALGIKLINSSLDNTARGLPRANGLTVVFDRETAYPVAMMEAGYLSAWRTAACSALAVDLLGRAGAARVGVIGAGVLAEQHIAVLAARRPGSSFAVYDLSEARRDELVTRLRAAGIDVRAAADAREAVEGATIVLTATTTTTGYLPYGWLAPGALVLHVSLDDVLPDVVQQAGLVVVDDWNLVSADDRRLLGRLWRSGDLLGPDGQAFGEPAATARRVDATLAGVIAGRHPGRTADDEVVLCNPFGMGILDVALARTVLDAAEAMCLGVELPR